jgi:DNA-binding SARP family transcriptional activator
VEFRLLGPLEVIHDGAPLPLGGPKQRSVLALLAFNANRSVSTIDLIDAIWGDEPPARATATVQVYVSNLRKALAGAVVGDQPRIDTVTNGYRLVVDAESVDVFAFERLIGLGRTSLQAGHAEEATACFDRALALWRETPGADLHGARVRHEAVRLEELRVSIIEDGMEARLSQGATSELVPSLEQLIKEHPYRERLRGQLMIALYRSGRQADALQAYKAARELLLDELGIDPSPDLRALEAAILSQTLDVRPPGAGTTDDGGVLAHDEAETVRLDSSGPPLGALVLPDGSRHVLGGQPCTIGRTRGCTVVLDNPNLSRRHAVVRLIGGTFVLSDLGSTNGTLVNGEAVADHELRADDQIDLAGSRLTYVPMESPF